MRRSSYQPYDGNVTLRSKRGFGHLDKVIWVKGKKYTEDQIARMLQSAYNLGRKEALEQIADAIRDAGVVHK